MSVSEANNAADSASRAPVGVPSAGPQDGLRRAGLVRFSGPATVGGGGNVERARGQNFLVERVALQAGGQAEFVCDDEMIVISQSSNLELVWGDAAPVALIPPCVAITPAGRSTLRAASSGDAIVISPVRDDATPPTLNADEYASPDPRVRRLDPPARRKEGGVKVIAIDEIQPPADKPRLRMLRSSSMSINWVKYSGPRNRRQLSPHSHADFEQGSLALAGDFVHHLRVPWGQDATSWVDDRHMQAPSTSLVVIPPGVIHTTEGIGDDDHLLIDIFAPARADFIERGWIANAADYE